MSSSITGTTGPEQASGGAGTEPAPSTGAPTAPVPPAAAGATRPFVRRRSGGYGRRARLEIHRFDTLTVLKFSAVWSVAVMIVTLVAVSILYWVLSTTGVIDSVRQALVEVTADAEGNSPVSGIFGFGSVLGFSLLSSLVFVICMTAVLTLTAVLYNASADLIGGVGVTLTDRV